MSRKYELCQGNELMGALNLLTEKEWKLIWGIMVNETNEYLSALAAIRATSLAVTTVWRRAISSSGSTGPSDLSNRQWHEEWNIPTHT